MRDRDLAHTRPYGEEVASQIDMEVKNIIDECYGKAKKMIEEHMDVLEKSAQMCIRDRCKSACQPAVRGKRRTGY